MFKVGDIFKIPAGECAIDHDSSSGEEFPEALVKITEISSTGYPSFVSVKNPKLACNGHQQSMILVSNEGETIMDEQGAPAQFVRTERNTELFKKGEVFKLEEFNYYEALNGQDALIDIAPGQVYARVPADAVARLPKVFVPVQKFNPEYVTAEENDKLQVVLSGKTEKKVPKKAKRA